MKERIVILVDGDISFLELKDRARNIGAINFFL